MLIAGIGNAFAQKKDEVKKVPGYKTIPSSSFLTINAEYLGGYRPSQFFNAQVPAFGLKLGTMRNVGWFVSAMTNFNFKGTFVTCTPEEIVPEVTSSSYFEALAGLTLRYWRPMSFHIGLGYMYRSFNNETVYGQWAHTPNNIAQGPAATAGLMFHFGGFVISAEVVGAYNMQGIKLSNYSVDKTRFTFGAKAGFGICIPYKYRDEYEPRYNRSAYVPTYVVSAPPAEPAAPAAPAAPVAPKSQQPETSVRTNTAQDVTTLPITQISDEWVAVCGQVSAECVEPVSERGVCWSTYPNPTVEGAYTVGGSGVGYFTTFISGLKPSTTYYFRAYARNASTVLYGNTVSVTLPVANPTSTAPASPQPMYQQPVYVQPAYPQPMLQQIVYPQPAYPQQMYPQPVYSQPAYPQPQYQQPQNPQPVYQQPMPQQPAPQSVAPQQPVPQQPAPQQPVPQQPAPQQPSPQQSVPQQPVPQQPAPQQPAPQPVAPQQPAPQQPAPQHPAPQPVAPQPPVLQQSEPQQIVPLPIPVQPMAQPDTQPSQPVIEKAAPAAPECPASVQDVDGNQYSTVVIGSQCWMKENMRAVHFVDGSSVTLSDTVSYEIPYCYFPNNDSTTFATYGLLYNWAAATNRSTALNALSNTVQGICPDGWHLPTNDDWDVLTTFLATQPACLCGADSNNIAKSLASTSGWTPVMMSGSVCCVGQNQGNNNTSGFGALPAGIYRNQIADFGSCACFWSAKPSSNGMNTRSLFGESAQISAYSDESGASGFSVRCLKDN